MKELTINTITKKASYLKPAEVNFVKQAFEFAKIAHKGQKRKTGEDYIYHPLHVAYYIASLGLGKDTIAAALLHDVLEDSDVTEREISKTFNPVVLKLVKGVTKLRHTADKKLTDDSVENLRRFLLVASEDIRVLIIKLADRLHNALTIQGLSPERQKTYAEEIKLVYSSLSEYLGIYYFKRRFDDIAFKILNPTEFEKIENFLNKHHRQRHTYIEKIVKIINEKLKKNKVKGEVSGRNKSVFSLYKKVQKYLLEGKIHSESEYGRVYDYYAFRILVKNITDCYRVLGIIHTNWHPLSAEFDDYIANPKPNGYRSLHTTVFCEDRKIAEIHILTSEMQEYNEFGPASHIAYKLAGKDNASPTVAFNWLKRISILRPPKKPIDESKRFKVKLFKDNVFVLTPDNEVKQLPKGSTPIDFAYTVHTEIGNKCAGAKVNGKMVPLSYELHTGDQVEILIDKRAKYPKSKWLEFVSSHHTRAKIKQALRKKEEKEAIEKGYRKLNERLKQFHTSFKKLYEDKKNEIDIFIYKNNAQNPDGLLARIGFDLLNTDKFISAFFPQKVSHLSRSGDEMLIAIEGSTQTRFTIAKCCDPKEGDPIKALTTISRGIRIHKAGCPVITDFEPERILEAHWTH